MTANHRTHQPAVSQHPPVDPGIVCTAAVASQRLLEAVGLAVKEAGGLQAAVGGHSLQGLVQLPPQLRHILQQSGDWSRRSI